MFCSINVLTISKKEHESFIAGTRQRSRSAVTKVNDEEASAVPEKEVLLYAHRITNSLEVTRDFEI